MPRPSKLFNVADRERVAQTVIQAENQTSAEIVPVVAASSGRYDRAEDIVGLWLGLIAMVALWWWLPSAHYEVGDWAAPPIVLNLLALIVAVVLGFTLGAVAASRLGWLRRLATPRRQMREEVQARARSMFFDRRVHHTAAGSGLLIYISLYERMAAVLADREVVEAVGQQQLDELCGKLTSHLAEGRLLDGLCETIAQAGAALAPVLPRSQSDVNELADVLVLID